MGWALGIGEHPRTSGRRRIGYGVKAKCDEPGCKARIDRGLAYLCGKLGGDDGVGCGGYFCSAHRTSVGRVEQVGWDSGERCPACMANPEDVRPGDVS